MLTNAAPTDNVGATISPVVGLIVALPAEARALGLSGARPGACGRWAHGWAALSGVGPDAAVRTAEQLLDHGVTRLANWGVAGALDAGLEPGDVLIPDRVVSTHDGGVDFTPDPQGCARLAAALPGLRVHRGTLCTVAKAAVTHADKQALATRTGAIAVDMEAAAIAAVAARAGLPFITVKAICDPLGREMPGRVAHVLEDHAGFSLPLLGAIALGGPPAWQATRELARDFARARHALAAAARLATFGT